MFCRNKQALSAAVQKKLQLNEAGLSRSLTTVALKAEANLWFCQSVLKISNQNASLLQKA